MRRAAYLVPLIGIVAAAGLPFGRHLQKQRHESTAVGILTEVRAAQERLRRTVGGYATDVESLLSRCEEEIPALDAAWLARLQEIGYGLEVRAAEGAQALGRRDCPGQLIAADYYVAVAPVDAAQPAQEAFAALAHGGIYLFYDGLPPTESDMASGLATPLEEHDTFKIP